MGAFPPTIEIPGLGGGGPGMPPGGPESAPPGGGEDPISLVQQAAELIRQAIGLEPDHEDKLQLEKLTTGAQQYIASQQQLVDTATGAGPGAKLVRKASSGGGGGGY